MQKHGIEQFPNNENFWRHLPLEITSIYLKYVNPIYLEFGDFGFYMCAEDWNQFKSFLREENVQSKRKDCWKGSNGKLLDSTTVIPYLKYYYQGYLEGWNNFENQLKTSPLFNLSEVEICLKIVQSISRPYKTGAIPKLFGFAYNISNESCFEAGTECGRFLKAWYLIINQPRKFLKYLIEPKSEVSISEKKSTQESERELQKNFDNAKAGEIVKDQKTLESKFQHSGVNITSDQVDYFFNAIKHKFANSEGQLFKLLNGEIVLNKIYFNGPPSQIAHAFGVMQKNNKINVASPSLLDEWLCKHFTCYKKNEPHQNIVVGSQMMYLQGLRKSCKNPLVQFKDGKVSPA